MFKKWILECSKNNKAYNNLFESIGDAFLWMRERKRVLENTEQEARRLADNIAAHPGYQHVEQRVSSTFRRIFGGWYNENDGTFYPDDDGSCHLQ